MSLRLNDKLPYFILKNQYNKEINSKNFYGKKLVVFFYPKDDTPGCTMEVCNFRDNYSEIKKYNSNIVGISSDSVKSHNNFSKKFNVTYDLLSDNDNKVKKLFGVPRSMFGLLPGRVTYIFNQESILLKIINSQINIYEHLSETIKFLKKLK